MENKKSVILITITAAVIISLAIIILYNLTRIRNNNRAQSVNVENIEEAMLNSIDENTIGNYIVTTSAEKERVSPNASIIFNKYYKDCGHTLKETEEVENTMVNLSENEIKDLFKDWKMTSFTNDKIELYKEFPGQCGEHFIIKDYQGHIGIYKNDSKDNSILMKETEIETRYLPDVDKENLKNGVEILGKEKLNSYLENFE